MEGLSGFYAKIEAEMEEKESSASLRSEIIKTFESLDQKNEIIQTYSELL